VDITALRTTLIVLIALTTLKTLSAQNVKQADRFSAARTPQFVSQIHAPLWIAQSRGRLVFVSNAVGAVTYPAVSPPPVTLYPPEHYRQLVFGLGGE
jgi:hypothetical protein